MTSDLNCLDRIWWWTHNWAKEGRLYTKYYGAGLWLEERMKQWKFSIKGLGWNCHEDGKFWKEDGRWRVSETWAETSEEPRSANLSVLWLLHVYHDGFGGWWVSRVLMHLWAHDSYETLREKAWVDVWVLGEGFPRKGKWDYPVFGHWMGMLRALGIVDKWSRGMEFSLGVWQPCDWWLLIFWVEQDWLTTTVVASQSWIWLTK